MKRLYVLLVILVVAALGLSPFVYGILFKRQLSDLILIVNQGHGVQLDLVEYQLGYMESRAKLKISPGEMMQSNPNIKAMVDSGNAGLLIELKINHGPIVYNPIEKRYALAYGSIAGFISLPEQIETFVFGKKQPNGFLQFNVVSSFGGKWFSEYKAPPATLPGPPGVSARWDGLDAMMHADVSSGHLVKYYSKLKLNSFVITPDAGVEGLPHVNMQPITYEGSMTNNGNVVIKSVFLAPDILIENPKTVLLVKGLKQTQVTTLNETDNMIDSYVTLNLDNFDLPQLFSIPLNKSSLYITINDFKLKEFQAFWDYTRSFNRKMNEDELKQLQELMPKILVSTSSIAVDIGLTSPLGVLIVNSKMAWPTPVSAPMNLPTMAAASTSTVAMRVSIALLNKLIETTAPLLIGPAQGDAAQTTPQPVDVLNQLVQTFVEKGYLTKDKDDYVTSIVYEKGVMKANGIEVKSSSAE